MEDLQSEVIELEFMEFAKGKTAISEEEFARILLRYTLLDESDTEVCIERVREKIPNEQVQSISNVCVYWGGGLWEDS